VCVCVCVPVCTEALGNARSMNTSHLCILCQFVARIHVPEGLHLLFGYHDPNRPVGIHIPAAI
jgi:hypothetical protein